MSESDESENNADIAAYLDSDHEDFEETLAANRIVSPRKKLKKRSTAWPYYEEIEEGGQRYAKCKLCVEK